MSEKAVDKVVAQLGAKVLFKSSALYPGTFLILEVADKKAAEATLLPIPGLIIYADPQMQVFKDDLF